LDLKTDAKKGTVSAPTVYRPWQKIWLDGLWQLGERAKQTGTLEIIYIVCCRRAAGLFDATQFFKPKFLAEKAAQVQQLSNFAPAGVKNKSGAVTLGGGGKAVDGKAFDPYDTTEPEPEPSDFDPAYALEGEVSRSALDWERRQILRAVAHFGGQCLQVEYVDAGGMEHGKPFWYKEPTQSAEELRAEYTKGIERKRKAAKAKELEERKKKIRDDDNLHLGTADGSSVAIGTAGGAAAAVSTLGDGREPRARVAGGVVTSAAAPPRAAAILPAAAVSAASTPAEARAGAKPAAPTPTPLATGNAGAAGAAGAALPHAAAPGNGARQALARRV
jgi:hypothetical protein